MLPVNVLLIDRSNHHVFSLFYIRLRPPCWRRDTLLLPLRGLLARQENTSVMLGEVIGVDKIWFLVRAEPPRASNGELLFGLA